MNYCTCIKTKINIVPSTVNSPNKIESISHTIKRHKEMRFRDLFEKEKVDVRKHCINQFETKADPFWYMCYRKKATLVEHKIIDPVVFRTIKEVETRIKHCVETKTNLDSLDMLFRLEDRKQLFDPKDLKNIHNYSLLGLCHYIKRVVLYDMDGLFPNIVTKKLIHAYMNNKQEYKRLLSYIPFILSVDEYKLFTRLVKLMNLIAENENYTRMCMISLTRLFSLSMFNQKAFFSLAVIPVTESILTDIINMDFDKIPETAIGNVLFI